MEVPSDESEVVARAKAGSELAWEYLIKAHQDRLVRLAWRMTGNRTVAQELAHEAFVQAFLNLNKLRENAAFGAWLRTILVRLGYRRPPRTVPIAEIPEDRRTPETDLASRELICAIDGAIASLDPLHRQSLALAMEGDLTSNEAGKLLGCSPEAYRFRVYQARRRLREMLARFLED